MELGIILNRLQPASFQPLNESEMWGREVRFEKGKSYLIDAVSGSGKTSLLSFIYGIRQDYTGEIHLSLDAANTSRTLQYPLHQEDMTSLWQKGIAFLFQDMRLFPTLTAIENVELKNQLTHFKTQTAIEAMFERLCIADKMNTTVNRLSLGQQQKVAFIRALCQPCDFLLLDEPVSHLDAANAGLMAQILKEEQQERQFGIIATSIGNNLPYDYDKIFSL